MNLGELREAIRPLTDECEILIEYPGMQFLGGPVKAELKFIAGEGFLVLRTTLGQYLRSQVR